MARLCVWLAVVGFVLAAARPLGGTVAARRVGILELVIDVSGSTMATDVVPTRVGAIQRSALRLLDEVPPDVRVGLVTFSTGATVLASPTADRDLVRRKLASLSVEGATAIGDALKVALADVQAARPAAAAAVLLLSDGANTVGSDPLEAARGAGALGVPVFAVGVGISTATVALPDEQTGQLRQVPVPPDPVGLAMIAGPTGGRALEARSAAGLDAALRQLAMEAGLIDPPELTMPFAAGALLLLAAAGALAPRRRLAPRRAGRLALALRLAPTVALLVAAGAIVVAWTLWVTPRPAPGPLPGPVAIVAPLPAKAPAARPRPFVVIESTTRRDKAVVERAAALLQRHGELASQRRAESRRRRLNRIESLLASACDDCKASELASGSGRHSASNGLVRSCGAVLNMPFVRQRARSWRVPVTGLVAMVMLHQQELCLHGDRSTTSPADAERRFARKLRSNRLFDRFYAQIDASARDRDTVEQALAIVSAHGELAFQRRDALRRRHRNQVDPLRIRVCHSCRDDRIGEATASDESGDVVACEILIDMSGVAGDARNWGLPVTDAVAVLLAHEQEHCIRSPDDHERPAVDEEVRLARKVGKARLIEYTTASYRDLDKNGYWKR